MTTLGSYILIALNFVIHPAWHLVVIYVILFLLVVYSMVKDWGF